MSVTLVIPTYNEAGNIGALLYEVVRMHFYGITVVDDNSPDGTASIAKGVPGVNVIVRRQDRGLSPAVREGALNAPADYIMVMDADGQHRPSDAEHMLEIWLSLETKPDVMLGSRFLRGSSILGLSSKRKLISKIFNWFCNVKAKTKTSDPMTGFCIVRRDLILQTRTRGFKFLYEILLNNELSVVEYPITFAKRSVGTSKADLWEVLKLLNTPRWGRAQI